MVKYSIRGKNWLVLVYMRHFSNIFVTDYLLGLNIILLLAYGLSSISNKILLIHE